MPFDPRGDCSSPKQVTLTIYEDRWGNHVVTNKTTGKTRKVAYRRIVNGQPTSALIRASFNAHATIGGLLEVLDDTEDQDATE